MYCFKCGKKLEKDAFFCSWCGTKVNGVTGSEVSVGKGRSIASLVLGILFGVLYLFASLDIDQNSLVQIYESYAFRFGYAIGSVLLPIIFAIIGICLALSDRNKKKTGLNMSGLILFIITFVLCGVIAVIVFTV